MMISYYKVRPDVLPPVRNNPSDAGLDLFYCPDMNEGPEQIKTSTPDHVFVMKSKNIKLLPGASVLIPSGLKFGIANNFCLMICNRSGIGSKKNLVVGSHIIDSGYSGQLLINLHNIGVEEQWIEPGDKVAQALMLPVLTPIPLEANNEESLYGMFPITIPGDRGDKGFGSSDGGKK